jgi:hypothetical protein
MKFFLVYIDVSGVETWFLLPPFEALERVSYERLERSLC